jgi:hypothetical protein
MLIPEIGNVNQGPFGSSPPSQWVSPVRVVTSGGGAHSCRLERRVEGELPAKAPLFQSFQFRFSVTVMNIDGAPI